VSNVRRSVQFYGLTKPLGVEPRGVVMSGAFTDLTTLLETYNIAGWIPLLQPLQLVPFFFSESFGTAFSLYIFTHYP